MAKIGINLDEIKEKEPLAPGVYTFTVRKSGLEPTKDQSSQNVVVELVPQESPSDIVFHRWSLKQNALTANSSSMSLKKALSVLGIPARDFDTDMLFGRSFRSTVKHEIYNGKTQVRLDEILGA